MATKPVKTNDARAVRVLCAITINETRYQPNDVIDGIPADVLAQYAGSLDSHPDAVAYAKSEGGKTHSFKA